MRFSISPGCFIAIIHQGMTQKLCVGHFKRRCCSSLKKNEKKGKKKKSGKEQKFVASWNKQNGTRIWTDELCFYVHIFCVPITIPGGFTSTFWNLFDKCIHVLTKIDLCLDFSSYTPISIWTHHFKHMIQWFLECI